MTTDGVRDLERAAADLASRLPGELAPLARVAYDFRWSWAPEGRALFSSLDPDLFRRCRGNPVALLVRLPPHVLEAAARDPELVGRAAAVEKTLIDDRAAAPLEHRPIGADRPVAFFCTEFGIHESLPIYQGGLGVLAGDVLKQASDLRLPMVGVGLLYSRGSFHQRVDPSGWQHDYWIETDRDLLPAALVAGADGSPLVVDVPVGPRTVHIQIWRVQVGRVPLFLLDADRPDNGIAERWITARLYVGDPHVRLEQYALLGVGGIRALRALGIDPSVIHLNEGHAAFAPIELAAEAAGGAVRPDTLEEERARTVFTTHTPVAAGNEAHDAEAVHEVLGGERRIAGDLLRRLGALGEDGDRIGMTSLGLRLSRSATAVSRLHGRVARKMWRPLFDVTRDEDVPIGHVTNGVHVPTWMSPRMQELLDRRLGSGWRERPADPQAWAGVDDIPGEELWTVRSELRSELVERVREGDAAARLNRHEDADAVRAALGTFDPDRLTVGFARRVATYKRLSLLFRDLDRLGALLSKDDTFQIVVTGKAHPRDEEAKWALATLFRQPMPPEIAARIAFLEDYDFGVARELVAGCDVWLNLPRPPMEASGTSGMKAAMNGGLNLSVSDGWWAEGYDGTNGWLVGDPVDPDRADGSDHEERDERDAASLFDLLEREVIPEFHDRDGRSVPRAWIRRVKASLRTVGPTFGATRMLQDYLERLYSAG